MLGPETGTAEHGGAEREPPRRASEFLRAHHHEVLSDWLEAMSVRHDGAPQRPSWLMDHMPLLLTSLADALEHGEQGAADALSDERAAVRLEQGFDVGEVAAEYALLRKCILRRLEGQPRPLDVGELERLEEALDHAVVRTVRRFAVERQRDIQGLEREARVEAQRSLALLDALLAAAPLGMAFLDLDLRYLRINQTLADVNGAPPEAHLGKTFRQMQPPELADLLEPLLLRVLRTGAPLDVFEFSTPPSLIAQRGKRVWQATFYPVHAPRGSRLLGLGCTVVDITEHKQTEAALQRAVDFREQLLAILGHDLRNPLNAIGASAFQLSRAEDLEAPERRAVERIRNSAGRMGRMITDILDFARSKLGSGIPVSRESMNLADICQATLDELQVSHPQRRLLFESSGDTTGQWDPDRVAQVLGNLVANALQHGGPDSPVSTSVRGEAEVVVMEVHNQGEPIPAELLPRIFDPFKSPVTSSGAVAWYPKQRGLGLGLYIVHQIARAHGGRVEVRSSREEGTTFRVYWPRRGA
ncbi:sensor histidine kinase [Myxococcus guangdongensis]|uniref:sensor histidine kinase n=1 Tax=Myxococcus guangdongensis TaxID=2906760 RepID=UPI0020A7B15C|nr:ATP-binding protein [Myxococcus guangdongensis]